MEVSSLSRGQLIMGAGGLVLIIALFLSWVSILGVSASAFDAFSGMDIIMLIIGVAALAYAVTTAIGASVGLPQNSALILALLGVVVFGWAFGWDLEEPNAGIGAWLGLFASIAIAYGGYDAWRTPAPLSATRTRRPRTSPPGPETSSRGSGTSPGGSGTSPGGPGTSPGGPRSRA
jgi:hypothetical protein